MAVWEKISPSLWEAQLEGWVYQFCVLEMKNFMRRKINRESRSERLDEKIPVKATNEESTEDLYEDIYAGLGKISPDYARVICLKHFGHMTFEEIAGRLEISPKTAKTRYYHGLIKLKGFLAWILNGWRGMHETHAQRRAGTRRTPHETAGGSDRPG